MMWHSVTPCLKPPNSRFDVLGEGLTEPQLRLFMSFDLQGSTKLKHQEIKHYDARRSEEWWVPQVLMFLSTFEDTFLREIESVWKDAKTAVAQPEVVAWKLLGDEIIFECQIQDREMALLLIEAQVSAVNKWNHEPTKDVTHKQKKAGPTTVRSRAKLRVKGSAWLAGFPVHNICLKSHSGVVDYIGPAMDLGFRLSHLASPRWLAISVDLLWFLGTKKSELKVAFDGRHDLKGVLDGRGYPSLRIKCKHTAMEEAETDLESIVSKDPTEYRAFCQSFIAETRMPPYLPFAYKPGTAPPGYEEELKIVRAALKTTGTRLSPMPIKATSKGSSSRVKKLIKSLKLPRGARGRSVSK